MDVQQSAVAVSPLDQLEAQVNLVLEHTGRIFAGSARNQKEHGIINNPARLKQVLSGAIDDFHDALDVLEAELALARAVMRRDLALCRTALSTQASAARVGEQTTSDGVKEESKPMNNGIDTDVTMSGDSPKTLEHSPPRKPEEAEKEGSNQSSEVTTGQPGQFQEPLQIEIPSGEHQGDNQTDTATGTYSNFDFESLFNDPSAHASPDVAPPSEPSKEASKVSSPAPEAPAPPTSAPVEQSQPKQPEADTDIDLVDAPAQDHNNNTDDLFDFGDLTNFGESGGLNDDNDNISSLLPGLESYANAPTDPGQQQSQPGTDTFNIFDAAGAPDSGTTNETTNSAPTTTTSASNAEKKKAEGEQQQGQTQEQQQQQPENQDENAEEPRDDTFDALMNFDNFDMGSFGADDGDGGSTAFDASFFDI